MSAVNGGPTGSRRSDAALAVDADRTRLEMAGKPAGGETFGEIMPVIVVDHARVRLVAVMKDLPDTEGDDAPWLTPVSHPSPAPGGAARPCDLPPLNVTILRFPVSL